jgi:hypothetical protein
MSDTAEIIAEIERHWPKKYDDDSLLYLAGKLTPYSLAELREALVACKTESKFTPKLPELLKRLPKITDTERPQSKYRTALARSIVGTQPQMNGRPEAELILRNARYFLRFKEKNWATNKAEFFGQDELPMDRLPGLKAETIVWLLESGWEQEHAEAAAEWIDVPLLAFQDWVESLRAVPMEIPEIV